MNPSNRNRQTRCGRALPAVLCLGLILLLMAASSGADVLTLNNGDELFGTILRANEREVLFRVESTEKLWPARDILKLEFDRSYGIAGEDTPQQVKDPIIRKLLEKMPTAQDYPQAQYLDVLDEEVFDVNADGTFAHTFRRVFVVLQEGAREEANHPFHFFPDQETFTLGHARSITPGQSGMLGFLGGSAGKVRSASSRTVAEEVDFYHLPQYQRRRTVKFAVPEVAIGTIVDWSYTVTRTKPDDLEPFFAHMVFQGMEPCQTRQLVVRIPSHLQLDVKVVEAGVPVQHQTIKRGPVVEHVFVAYDVPGLPQEPLMASPVRFGSQVLCAPKGEQKALATAYGKILGERSHVALQDTTLRETANRICGDATDPAEKARRIYRYLARDIANVPITPHDFSFLPLEPRQILESKQASYLDKTFLYHVFLTIAGVDHDLLLVRSAGAGPWRNEVSHLHQGQFLGIRLTGHPTPFAFNVPWSDKYVPDMLPTALQGATGMLLPGGEPVEIPLMPAPDEEDFLRTEGRVDPEGNVTLTTWYRPQGANATSLRFLKDMTKDQIRVMLETELAREFPGAALQDFETTNISDPQGSPELRYTFRVAHFARRSGDDLLVIPVPVERSSYSTTDVGLPDRRTPIFWAARGMSRTDISLTLPADYTLYALPEGSWAMSPQGMYFSTFGWEKGRVLFRDRFVREKTSLDPTEYAGWKALMETRGQTTGRWIVAVRQAAGAAPREP